MTARRRSHTHTSRVVITTCEAVNYRGHTPTMASLPTPLAPGTPTAAAAAANDEARPSLIAMSTAPTPSLPLITVTSLSAVVSADGGAAAHLAVLPVVSLAGSGRQL